MGSDGSRPSLDAIRQEPIVSAWRGHEGFAWWLVKRMRPDVVVDLGVDYGFSSFVFAAAGAGAVFGIDTFEGDPEAGVRDTFAHVEAARERLGLHSFVPIRGSFREVAETWDRPIDILHIDGRHRYEDVKEDFETWSRFVRPGGVVLMHDTEVRDEPFGVHRLFHEIALPKTSFQRAYGLGVVTTDRKLLRAIAWQAWLDRTLGAGWRWLGRVRKSIRPFAGRVKRRLLATLGRSG